MCPSGPDCPRRFYEPLVFVEVVKTHCRLDLTTGAAVRRGRLPVRARGLADGDGTWSA